MIFCSSSSCRILSRSWLCSSIAFMRLWSAAFSRSRLDRVRAFLLSASSSFYSRSTLGSPCEEPVSLLGPSSPSGPPRSVVVSAGVVVAVSLLVACSPVDGPAVVVTRREGFLRASMIVTGPEVRIGKKD
jgi:hypothetical protein